MIRVTGIVCLIIAALIVLVSVIGIADHIDSPVPAVVVIGAVGALCLWLAFINSGRHC